MAGAFDLDRFIEAQQATYPAALRELRSGRKSSHWMWFVFPQLRGLGRSETSLFYGLEGLPEARAYLAHPVLGPRLRAACEALLRAPGDADRILGAVDALKLRSSMTLFRRAVPGDSLFDAVLERFYGGEPDPLTEALLAEASS